MLSFAFVLPEKRLHRDTKLIAILRRQFCTILTALEENIFSIAVSKAQLVYSIKLINDIAIHINLTSPWKKDFVT